MKTVNLERIGPNEARRILSRLYEKQRKVRPRKVSTYAEEMRRGDWVDGASQIAIDQDGMLIDGQHRLLAVIESGESVEFIVARGLPTSAYDVIDQGVKRSARDVLRFRGVPNYRAIAATAGVYLKAIGKSNNRSRSARAVVDFCEDNSYTLTKCVESSSAFSERRWVVPQSYVAASLFYLTTQGAGHDDIVRFASDVERGYSCYPDDPVILVRDAYMSGSCSGVPNFWAHADGMRRGRAILAITTYVWFKRQNGDPARMARLKKTDSGLYIIPGRNHAEALA